MTSWMNGGAAVRKWVMLAIAGILLAICPVLGGGDQSPTQLLEIAQASRMEAHAFFLRAQVTLPTGQAQAALKLAQQAAREWPSGQASLSDKIHPCTLVLAAACPPDAAQARDIARRMRSIMGRGARITYCLTARADARDLASLAAQALISLDDAPQERLLAPDLVSLTGTKAQVALRRDATGAQAYLAQPLIPMDY